jgi:hypothetical protein
MAAAMVISLAETDPELALKIALSLQAAQEGNASIDEGKAPA